ncbi:type II secretion system protein [Candidatus Kaiserbacteria bacterium]|nr:type II secretion system protein [Candidatus Kaiserbacteria bacterium]USN92708.1 MAG: type II secretion system protein [Candidatus Nomurabacteria bacterium]
MPIDRDKSIYEHLRQDGFTLIELLVVITIVGILSAVVLSSLKDMRMTAKDTLIKQQIRSIVTAIELDYGMTGTYAHNDLQWFRLPPTTSPGESCADKSFTGPQATELRKLCYSIEENINHDGLFGSGLYMIWGIHQNGPTPRPDPARYYAIMVMLNSGQWYCVGVDRGVHAGTLGQLANTTFNHGDCFSNP